MEVLDDHRGVRDNRQIGKRGFQQPFRKEENRGGGVEKDNVAFGNLLHRQLGNLEFELLVPVDAILKGGGEHRHFVGRFDGIDICHAAVHLAQLIVFDKAGDIAVNGCRRDVKMFHEFIDRAVFFLFQIVNDRKSSQIFHPSRLLSHAFPLL